MLAPHLARRVDDGVQIAGEFDGAEDRNGRRVFSVDLA
jgi:hypothetical protein